MDKVQFKLEDGSVAFVEAYPGTGIGVQPFASEGGAVRLLSDAMQPVTKMAALVVAGLKSAVPDAPDEVEVTFSLKASLDVGGFFIGKLASEGNYIVKLVWKAQRTQPEIVDERPA